MSAEPQGASDSTVPAALRIFDNAPLLLILTMTFWAGNGVLVKWVALSDELPPVALAFWRWIIALCLILPFAWPHLKRDWPALKQKWRVVLIMSFFGITMFNTLIYWSQYFTSAVNLFLLNATLPLLIPAFSFLFFRDRVTRVQLASIVLALTGAVTIISGGDISVLTGLAVNNGDLLIVFAMISYAIYSVCLRLKPVVHPMTMLFATFTVGMLFLVPVYIWEHLYVAQVQITAKTAVALAYVGIFPSFAAYLCYNRGIELIGANRASLYFHLMPVIGTIFAVLLFAEPLRWYHAVGAVLIVTGIIITTRKPR